MPDVGVNAFMTKAAQRAQSLFVVVINTDNDAFVEAPAHELGHILLRAAKHVEDGRTEAPLLDSNGNTVGFMQYPADPTVAAVFDVFGLIPT